MQHKQAGNQCKMWSRVWHCAKQHEFAQTASQSAYIKWLWLQQQGCHYFCKCGLSPNIIHNLCSVPLQRQAGTSARRVWGCKRLKIQWPL